MPARQTFRVYLAGPISRCNDAQMRRWRETVKGEYGSKMTFLDPVDRLARIMHHGADPGRDTRASVW